MRYCGQYTEVCTITHHVEAVHDQKVHPDTKDIEGSE